MKRKGIAWRLGLDLGTNSIGWCVFDLSKPDQDGRRHPIGIRRSGVRIFPDGRDPQSGASLAASRREPRSARRRRDRFLMRRSTLLHALIRHGLMPSDPAERSRLVDSNEFDPWKLRAEGLDRKLTPYEVGRVLFHLNQRRGFLSNRKADRTAQADEKHGMKAGQKKLEHTIADMGARTLGEFLYRFARENRTPRGGGGKEAERGLRFRAHIGKGGKAEWDFYPTRAMMLQEFDLLWREQAKHHSSLTDAARSEIEKVIFHQRPLKPVLPGPCTFEQSDERAPLALPLVQEFRILQELANLELVRVTNPTDRHRLTLDQRDALLRLLMRREKVTFKKVRATLEIEASWRFNLESEKRKDLKGDRTSYRLSRPECFGDRWFDLSSEAHNRVVEWLVDMEDEAALKNQLMGEFGVTPEQAEQIANIPLEDGHGRLGRVALGKIVPLLRTGQSTDGGPLRYSEAVKQAGYEHHSDFRDGEIVDLLPYYGEALRRYMAPVLGESASADEQRFGRIANPTVHVGLNQLRRLVNTLIDRYGHPEEIVVELARDLKLSRDDKERIEKDQAANQKKNEMRAAKLSEIFGPDRRPPGDAMLRMRLWEELNPEDPNDRKCIYTGKQISIQRLFSAEVEIEHIMPFTKSLDDSLSNLTVSIRHANRDKGGQTPHEAFGHGPTIGGFTYDWDKIVLRASALPKGKQWRFRPDAMELVKDRARRAVEAATGTLTREDQDDIERSGGFLARQLIDTAYLARVTRQYLWKVCDPNKTWVIPGTMTALLRRKWGLNGLLSDHNRKNRTDHRHHAIDAFVVGLTDRSMLQAIAGSADEQRDRVIDDMPDPIDWPSFRDDLRSTLGRMVVSYKPDHGTQGRLHEETAYGLIRNPELEGGATLVYRKAIADLNPNEIERVRDRKLREALRSVATPVAGDKPKLKAALATFAACHSPPLRHVRLSKVERAFETVRDRNGQPYKALTPGENHHVDIIELPGRDKWIGVGVTVFAANRLNGDVPWRHQYPNGRLVMRVHKGDAMTLTADGGERIYRVVKLSPVNRRLILAGQYEGGNLDQRDKDGDDAFKWITLSFGQMRARKARRITVDPLGRIRDPGPPK